MASKRKASGDSTSSQSEETIPSPPTKRVTRSHENETNKESNQKVSTVSDVSSLNIASTSPKRATRSSGNKATEDTKENASSATSSAFPCDSREKLSPSTSTASPPVRSTITVSRPSTHSQEKKGKADSEVNQPSDVETAAEATKQTIQSQGSEAKENFQEKSSPTTKLPLIEGGGVSDANKTLEKKSSPTKEKKSPSGKLLETKANNIEIDHAYPLASGKDSSKKKPGNDSESQQEDQIEEQTESSQDASAKYRLSDGGGSDDDEGEEGDDGEAQTNSELDNIIECKFCSDFFTLASLKKHIEETHTHVETEVCPNCGYCERDGGPMSDHPSCFACWTCAIFFNSKSRLKKHMLLHDVPDDEEDWHVCGSCQAKFSTRRGLEIHLKCHKVPGLSSQVTKSNKKASDTDMMCGSSEDDSDEEIPIKQCRKCRKFFKSDKSLHRHVKRKHTKVKTEICDSCGFFQRLGGPLGKHKCETEKEHVKIKRMKHEKKGDRYACKLCAKTYAYHQGLRAHMNTHKPPSEKPYHCDICQKAFAKKILYEDHCRIHSGEKPYLCHMCAKFFRSGANLRQHQRRCKNKVIASAPCPETKQENFICHLCSELFTSEENVREHQRSSHNTGYYYSLQTSPRDLVEEVIEKEEPVMYEVQMEVVDGQGQTVVINLGSVERASSTFEGSSGITKAVESSVSQAEYSKAPTASSDNTGVAEGKAGQPNVVPVAIHKGPTDETRYEASSGEANEQVPVKREESENVDTKMDGDEGGKDHDHQEENNLSEPMDEAPMPMDEAPEPMDDSDQSNPPPVDVDDHDYIREKHSVLEEQKVDEKNVERKLLEVYYMCPKCKDLFDSKLANKRHMRAKHKKAKKHNYEGIVVLGTSGANKRRGAGEDTLPVDWAYQCSHCNAFFPEEQIESHLEVVGAQLKPGFCKVCFRKHKEGAKSLEHCKLSRARKVFQCPYCNVKPAVLCDMRSHLAMRHGDNTYPCTLCEETFTKKRGLTCHMQKHRREDEPKAKKKKTYICEKCSKILTDTASFRIHMMQHDNPKPFACKLCPKAYPYPNGLRVHMRGHTKNFPFLCEYCSRTFKTKACLICHIRCHTGDKPFNCVHCGKAFRTKANMRQHLKRCNFRADTVETETIKELEIATEVVTGDGQPETYMLLVQKAST